MFRKLRSERDPKDTLLSQLSAEFRPYLEKTGARTRRVLVNHPKSAFCCMIALILASACFSFFLPLKSEPAKNQSRRVSPVDQGFGQIADAASRIHRTLSLKREIDSLSSAKVLSRADSQRLEQALDRLRQIQQNQLP